MRKLSFNGKRVIAGIGFLISLFCLGNYLLDFHIFGRFNKEILIASVILNVLYLHYFGPTLRELQDHRDNNKRSQSRS